MTKPTLPPQLPDPKQGGSYIRNKDGSLQLVSQTTQQPGRVKREPAAPAAPAQPKTINEE